MAFADTAKLIVELGLRDKLSRGLGGVNRTVGALDRNMGTLNTRVSRTGTIINTALGVGLERVVTSGVAALISGIRNGVAEMQRLEDANLQTAAAIESTDGVAGQTVKGIRAMAEEYEALNATVDDKAIQEAANVLLTFRKVGEQAFEPALESALNLSTALKQDLQTSIVQIGKALEDPVRGVTALRRAGVQFTKDQEDQIKALVESNDLYGAQALILKELNTQVGGRFAAQGKGDAARAAKLRDTLEDLQRVAAEGLAPGLTRVREALISAFDNPQVIAGVRAVGENIANFLSAENLKTAGGAVKDVFGFLSTVPWGAIGEGLRITGSAAKVAIDAFKSLPKEVQGLVIAGLAVNKLSGGIAGSLAVKGIEAVLGGLKTINAAHVTVVGGSVTGGGLPGAGGKGGGGLVGGLKTGAAIAAPLLVGVAAVEVINFQNMRDKATGFLEGKLDDLDRTTVVSAQSSINKIQAQIDQERPFLEGILFNTNVKPVLEREIGELQDRIDIVKANTATAAQAGVRMVTSAHTSNQRLAEVKANTARTAADAVRMVTAAHTSNQRLAEVKTNTARGAVEGARMVTSAHISNQRLLEIRNKKSSVNVTVNSQTNVSLSAAQMALRVTQINQTIHSRQDLDEFVT